MKILSIDGGGGPRARAGCGDKVRSARRGAFGGHHEKA